MKKKVKIFLGLAFGMQYALNERHLVTTLQHEKLSTKKLFILFYCTLPLT